MDPKHVRNMKLLLLASSLASLVVLLFAAYEENFRGSWRDHQGHYKAA
ncbi:MAG: hypothetical protein R3E58_02960 [Phycisphaerae bacterium]